MCELPVLMGLGRGVASEPPEIAVCAYLNICVSWVKIWSIFQILRGIHDLQKIESHCHRA